MEFLIKYYEWIMDIAEKRNMSIFAHGYKPIAKTDLESIKFKLENEFIKDLENRRYPSHSGTQLKFKEHQLPTSLEDFGMSIYESWLKI